MQKISALLINLILFLSSEIFDVVAFTSSSRLSRSYSLHNGCNISLLRDSYAIVRNRNNMSLNWKHVNDDDDDDDSPVRKLMKLTKSAKVGIGAAIIVALGISQNVEAAGPVRAVPPFRTKQPSRFNVRRKNQRSKKGNFPILTTSLLVTGGMVAYRRRDDQINVDAREDEYNQLMGIRASSFDVNRMSLQSSFVDEEEDLRGASVGSMRAELRSLGVPTSTFTERSQFVEALSRERANGNTAPSPSTYSQPFSSSAQSSNSQNLVRNKSKERSFPQRVFPSRGKDISFRSNDATVQVSRTLKKPNKPKIVAKVKSAIAQPSPFLSKVRSHDEKVAFEKEKLKNKSVGYMKKELRILGIPTSSFRETSEFVNALSEIRANGVNESSIFSDAVQASNRLKQTTPWEPSFSDDLNTSKVSNLRGNNQTPSSPVNNRKVSSSFREKDDSNKFYSNLSQNNPQQDEYVNPSEEQKYYPRQFKQRPLQPKEQTGDYDSNGYKDVSVRKLSDEWWSADRNGNAPIDV